jgi:2-methylcitrate dehydratase PrpD
MEHGSTWYHPILRDSGHLRHNVKTYWQVVGCVKGTRQSTGGCVASTRLASTQTGQLADLVAGLTRRDIPAEGLELVSLATLDALGCALAGAGTPERMKILAWASTLGVGTDAAVVGGGGRRLAAALAALVNATGAHALDLDDVSPTMTHPSASLVPALLAVGERMGACGADLQVGYVAGFEVCARLCRILNPEHYHDGWHTTGTVNTLGVAAAVGRLLQLDADQLRIALGIAAASASGIRKNFGTMIKPLHAGNAAFHGVAAAELAAAGFTADTDVLDGRLGYLDVFSRGAHGLDGPIPLSAELELLASGITFKRYACCGALHTAVDGLLDIMALAGIGADKIARIQCVINARADQVLVYHHASTPAEGRFCVEYTLAVAALDGAAGPAQYSPGRVASAGVQELAGRVTVVVDPQLPTGYASFPSIVTVQTRDGASLEQRVDVARGEPGRPFTAAEIADKFRACAAAVLSPSETEQAISAVLSLGELSNARELGMLVSGTG